MREGDGGGEDALALGIGILHGVEEFGEVVERHRHERLGEHVIHQPHERGEHLRLLRDALEVPRALDALALHRHHTLRLAYHALDAVVVRHDRLVLLYLIHDVAYHALQNLLRALLRRFHHRHRVRRALFLLVRGEVLDVVRHDGIQGDGGGLPEFVAQRPDLHERRVERALRDEEFSLNLGANEGIHLVPHVPTPELEHLVHEVILEEAHLTQQGEDGGVAHPLAERGELALHTRANVHHARARHRVVLDVLVLHVLLWHHRKIVGGVRVVRHGRIHAVEHLDGRAEAVSDVVLDDLLRVGDELLPGEHVLRLPRGEGGGGGAHGRAGAGRGGVRVEAAPAAGADGGAAGRGRPVGRAGGGSAVRARLLRFRAGRARHGGTRASLAGAQRRKLQPRGAVRVGDVHHVLRGVHRRPRRARLDRARGRGRPGQPARARNVPLGVASVPREPRRRDAHETGPVGAERGGFRHAGTRGPLAAPAGEARVALGPSHGARRINRTQRISSHPGC